MRGVEMSKKSKEVDRVVNIIRDRDMLSALSRKEPTEELYRHIEYMFNKLTPTEALHLAKRLGATAREKLRASLEGE
jgi:hypothetical protein